MSKNTFKEETINKLLQENISVIKVYDEENKIHFRIAVQDINSNKIFIEKMNKIMKEEY